MLDKHRDILDRVHRALVRGLGAGGLRGRKATYTSEILLRALIVHTREGESLRGTIVRIAHSPFLQEFLRLGGRPMMDYSLLDRAFKAIPAETWKEVNAALGKAFAREGQIEVSAIRTDTTVVEANIHYPTDSSLLWDGWRVLSRLLRRGRALAPEACAHRFHDAKVRKRHLFVTRYMSSPARARRRAVRREMRALLESVRRIAAHAEAFCQAGAKKMWDFDLLAIRDEILGFLPLVKQVVGVAERVTVAGEKVPASERCLSLFEPHVELIQRGKRAKPIEFGHVVRLTQTGDKFITDYDVLARRVPDSELTPGLVKAHQRQFGKAPEVLVADHGYHSASPDMAKVRRKVKTVAIPERVTDWGKAWMKPWQAFRAGIEGSISVLKRAFSLARSLFHGFNSFAAGIGLAIFCHNLVVLSPRTRS